MNQGKYINDCGYLKPKNIAKLKLEDLISELEGEDDNYMQPYIQ